MWRDKYYVHSIIQTSHHDPGINMNWKRILKFVFIKILSSVVESEIVHYISSSMVTIPFQTNIIILPHNQICITHLLSCNIIHNVHWINGNAYIKNINQNAIAWTHEKGSHSSTINYFERTPE